MDKKPRLRKTKAEVKHAKRWSSIKRKYGLSQPEWEQIFNDQGGCCFICRRRLKVGGKNTRLSANTDHCHTTGKIRGILCRRCNMDIVPRFEINPGWAINLHTYLTRDAGYGVVPGEVKDGTITSSDTTGDTFNF